MTRVFMSFRPKSSSTVAQLLNRELEARQISVFLDKSRSEENAVYPVELLSQIEASDVFVCVVGAGTFDHEWVQIEIEHAQRSKIPMIPVFQESYEPVPFDKAQTPFVRSLLEEDGVLIFDVKNVYIPQTIDMLAKVIENTVAAQTQSSAEKMHFAPPVTLNIEQLAGKNFAHYQLRELLGSGGLSVVYRALDTRLSREVALKLLSPMLAQQYEAKERFLRAARTAAALEHVHIVPVHEYGIEEGLNYLAMRLLSGGSLADRINQQIKTEVGLPDLRGLSGLLHQLASALDYAHSRGVIHRGITVNKILFDDLDNVYITDFGIAKVLEVTAGLTGTGMTIGVPNYMPPEQWLSESITAATDQYALGVVVYYTLTGYFPFEAETPYALMHKHLTEVPPSPESRRPGLPATLTPVLHQVLAKEPNQRFPSVKSFADAFEEAIRGYESVQTSFISQPPPHALPVPSPAPTKPTPRPSVSIDNLVGETLGQYEVRALLGIGGLGALYQVYQPALKRNVALKIALPNSAQDLFTAELLALEAQTTAALEHPNIAPIHDFGSYKGLGYIVMRLLTGDTLIERMVKYSGSGEGSLPLKEVIPIIKDIASALDYAHSCGIIHRDVKPNNIVFDQRGTPHLLDFSVALHTHTAQIEDESGMVVGTPRFMAPEQWSGSDVGPASDQYGLAVTTYYLITGHFPFDAPTSYGVMHKHLNEEPASPQVYRSEISQNVAAVVLKALAKRPQDRYASATEFAQELEKASASSPNHLFISYSRRDKEYAVLLTDHLKKHGFEVWIDARIEYGDTWFNEIEDAINECSAFLLVMTPDSKQSEWVQKEILLAKRRKKPLFPLLRLGEEFGIVIDIQFADVRSGQMPDADFHQRLRRTVYGDA